MTLNRYPVESLKDLKREVVAHVEPGANVMTDEWPGYKGLQGRFNHHTVNHAAEEYVHHYYAHVNGIEGVWSLPKRQIYGIHHFVSGKHLAHYVDEAVFRFNRRAVSDAGRVTEFLTRVDGRLTYNVLIGEV
jgi:hypothetical protein